MTVKYLKVTMSDGSKYDVPATIIAKNRALYYAKHDVKQPDNELSYEEIYNQVYEDTLSDNYEFIDWAENNMNWDDIKSFAIKVQDADEVDFQECWVNGEKEIITKTV